MEPPLGVLGLRECNGAELSKVSGHDKLGARAPSHRHKVRNRKHACFVDDHGLERCHLVERFVDAGLRHRGKDYARSIQERLRQLTELLADTLDL